MGVGITPYGAKEFGFPGQTTSGKNFAQNIAGVIFPPLVDLGTEVPLARSSYKQQKQEGERIMLETFPGEPIKDQ